MEYERERRKRVAVRARLRAAGDRHYAANREKILAAGRARRQRPDVLEMYRFRNAIRIAENRAYINEFKRRPCADCGNSFPSECMDLDHIPSRGPKVLDLCRMLTRTRHRLEEELAKCEVVCANCHRTRTKQRGCNQSESTRPILLKACGIDIDAIGALPRLRWESVSGWMRRAQCGDYDVLVEQVGAGWRAAIVLSRNGAVVFHEESGLPLIDVAKFRGAVALKRLIDDQIKQGIDRPDDC